MTTNIERNSESATASSPSKAKRRWFAFSLRTLLMFMLTTSIGLGYYAKVAMRIQEQRAIRDQLVALGARAYFDNECARGGYTPEKNNAPAAPVLARWIWGNEAFEHIEVVAFERPIKASDDDVQLLLKTPKLEDLELWGERISDRSMATVGKLHYLQELELCDTEVSDEGIAQLVGLQNLVYLSLRGTPITSAALGDIAKLTNLEGLDLQDTTVSDDNLNCLAQLTKLRNLWLGSHVSAVKARELKKVLPNCTISCVDEQGASVIFELNEF